MRGRALPRRAVAAFAVLLLGACGAGDAPPRHLLLITVDTLRADRLGAYGYARAQTPAIDALAARSLRFERAYAHASATVPSMASLLTGRLPAAHGALNNAGRITARMPTLAEILAGAGFDTAAFVGNWALRRGRGFDRGFARYTERFVGREAVRPQPENPGALLADQARAWMAARDAAGRFFLWVHFQEPHGPYTPPTFEPAAQASRSAPHELPRSPTNAGRGAIPAYQWQGHGRLAEYLARYDGEVAETDRQVGRVVEALDARGLAGDTLVVFTADHGEAFGEEGIFLAHGDGLGEALVRVPLLIRRPGGDPALRSDLVRLIDVAPTVLGLLGVPDPGLPGRSLLEPGEDRLAVAQLEPLRGGERWRAVRDGRLELRETSPGVQELRDAHGDPVPPDREPEARARLAAALDRLAPWQGETASPVLGEEERDALRALGYVD